MSKLKEVGNVALGITVFLAILSIPILVIGGSKWAADNLLQPLTTIGGIALVVDILILLPLSIFSRLRSFTGNAIVISSYLFGLITWLFGFILTWQLWGGWAVALGVIMFGGAVVPFALLAVLFKGMWGLLITLLVMVTITLVSRIGGAAIAELGA